VYLGVLYWRALVAIFKVGEMDAQHLEWLYNRWKNFNYNGYGEAPSE
jgi:hypothetical protein